MDYFVLTPDEFEDQAEYRDPAPFSTRAGFIASRERTPPDELDAAWEYFQSLSFRGFALVITLTP